MLVEKRVLGLEEFIVNTIYESLMSSVCTVVRSVCFETKRRKFDQAQEQEQ